MIKLKENEICSQIMEYTGHRQYRENWSRIKNA